jgi:hypothetical protein
MTKPECPLCRAPIVATQFLDIFDNTCAEAVFSEVLSQPIHVQNTQVESFDMINQIHAVAGEAHASNINYIIRTYMHLLHVDGVHNDDTFHRLTDVFFQAARFRFTHGTLTGFVYAPNTIAYV